MPSRHRLAALSLALALALALVVPAATAPAASATPGQAAASAPVMASAPVASTPTSTTTSGSLAPPVPAPRTGWTSTTSDFANDLESGTALPPSKSRAGVQRVKTLQDSRTAPRRFLADTPTAVTAEPLSPYSVSGVVLRPTPLGQRPYEGVPLVRGLVDSSGVRMFTLAGDPTVYNHPVGQAQLSMAYLDYYRLTGLPAYLRLAKANAQRLIDRRVEARGGWFYPYDFDFAVHGDTSLTMIAPWYSGMAQGVALSAFTRLFQATGDPAWKAAADATFASLDTAPVEGEPFGSWVSDTGDLWLELYPRWPVETSERVLNGHIFAAFGLYDYAQLTGSEEALRLYDGAMATVARYLMSDFRTPRWASLYSLAHRLPTIGYHQRVVVQMQYLQHQTGNPIYASWASTLRSDYPVRTSNGFAIITPLSKVRYRLSSARTVVSSRAVKLFRSTGAPVDRRERVHGGTIMLRVSAGAWAGWWFPEALTKARIRGPVDQHFYEPALQATFAAGKSTGAYVYDAGNALVGSQTLTFTESTQLPVTRSAIVDGRLAYFLPSGPSTGQWVGAQSGLTVG